jgi:hypothetical protein
MIITSSCNINYNGSKYIFPKDNNVNYFIVRFHDDLYRLLSEFISIENKGTNRSPSPQ